jgi:hypothetical protein
MAPAQMTDRAGFKDPPLFTRLPGYYLAEGGAFEEREFDSYEFWVSAQKKQKVEGRFSKYSYSFDESTGKPAASRLQVFRNYQNAVRKIGGKVVYDGDEYTTLVVAKDGKETWVEVISYSGYALTIIERAAMEQKVTADASAFKNSLAQVGHVEVPGIYFDFGKSEVKGESEPALKEVVKLLQANPAMKVWVVGHTDAVGSEESNVGLSSARAAAVIRVLTGKMGVDAARLAAHGAGPFSPVASNKTEEGRAKNRRVELVDRP